MFAELQTACCEMKERLVVKRQANHEECHALYVGREIRYLCMLKMFWNKENVWNDQVIEMIVKNEEEERIIIRKN